ncbi:41145_t:CDS:2, partial [Gigaspora margarita]
MIDESEISQRLKAQLPRGSASSYISQIQNNSLNHGSSSLHTSVKASDRQIKKRRSNPKFIQVSDLSTNSDTQLEQVLNEEEKQIK